jgi:undecaprenol kinase
MLQVIIGVFRPTSQPGFSMKNATFLSRLGFALSGIGAIFAREKSFRTQVAVAVAVLVATVVVQPGLIWCAMVALSIGLVLGLELVNSALEQLIDHLHPSIHPAIKIAKDAAAGAVLLASFAAACVGIAMLISVVLR